MVDRGPCLIVTIHRVHVGPLLGPLTCVAILYESFDIFSYLWPIVSSADEFGSFCCSAVSRLWGFVMFSDKSGSYPFLLWYPNLSLIP